MSILPTEIQELAMENEMLHAENALKLTQILDLEQLVYDLKNWTMYDGSPCWCVEYEGSNVHSPLCDKARQATEPFWKKVK